MLSQSRAFGRLIPDLIAGKAMRHRCYSVGPESAREQFRRLFMTTGCGRLQESSGMFLRLCTHEVDGKIRYGHVAIDSQVINSIFSDYKCVSTRDYFNRDSRLSILWRCDAHSSFAKCFHYLFGQHAGKQVRKQIQLRIYARHSMTRVKQDTWQRSGQSDL